MLTRPDTSDGSPAVEYLLKEVSFSTCDNRFFGELEKEMLIPNNINIYGKIKGAASLKSYKLRVEFPAETVIAYLKHPLSNEIEGSKRVLTYKLDDLINFDNYWWLPLQDETEFSLSLNLLPPFPELNPVDLQITCRPDIAVGLQTDVTTTVQLEAEEEIDNVFLRLGSPVYASPGVSMAITEYSGDEITEPRQSVTSPKKEFPFPRLSLKPGQTLEYKAKTRITADPSSMNFLKCQQDILNTKLLLLSESTPASLPCSVTVLNNLGLEVPIHKTVRSTILQANAQVMYSPFSIRRETQPEQREVLVQAPAH
jgi:hypothetical protein